MNNELQIIAELSVAIAAFSGLVFALDDSEVDDPVKTFRVRNLLSLSFATMFTALVPMGFALLGIDSEQHWRIASGFLFLTVGGALGVNLPTYFRLNVSASSSVSNWMAKTILPLLLINLLVQLLHAVGLVPQSPGIFFYGLVIALLAAAGQFMTSILARGT